MIWVEYYDGRTHLLRKKIECPCPYHTEMESEDAAGSESPAGVDPAAPLAGQGSVLSSSPYSSIFAEVARELIEAKRRGEMDSEYGFRLKKAEAVLSRRFGPLVEALRTIANMPKHISASGAMSTLAQKALTDLEKKS
jgi:hypothetical protein